MPPLSVCEGGNDVTSHILTSLDAERPLALTVVTFNVYDVL
jgi:hypothetical protein